MREDARFIPLRNRGLVENMPDLKSREVVCGQATLAGLLAGFPRLRAIVQEVEPDLMLAYNDQIGLSPLFAWGAQRLCVDICFNEISNFPGYLQSNSVGVNSRTSIDFTKRVADINTTLQLKQVYGVSHKDYLLKWNYLKLLDALCLRRPRQTFDENSETIRLFADFVLKSTTANERILFVEQVANDTNILCNSSINILEFARVAERVAVERELVWKTHPKQTVNFSVNVHRTEKSIEDAFGDVDTVVTINSTVEIEALLADKRVITLGDSVFSKIAAGGVTDGRDILSVFLGNCVKVEYFSTDPIPISDLL